MKIELPSGKVVDIAHARESRQIRTIRDKCPHLHVEIHQIDGLECKDCGKQLNPVGWIVQHMEEWQEISRVSKAIREAQRKFEERLLVKCKTCGKFTRVHL